MIMFDLMTLLADGRTMFCDLNTFPSLLSDFMINLLSTKLILLLTVCCDKMLIFGGIRFETDCALTVTVPETDGLDETTPCIIGLW